MRTFESYLVFSIFALGTVLDVGGFEYQQFLDEMLDLHNLYRKYFGAEPLKWDENLSKEAAKCMEPWIVYERTKVDVKWDFDENWYYLFYVSNDEKDTAQSIFSYWYKQSYVIEPENELYPQILWKNCTRLGIAVVKRYNRNWILIMYYPNGKVVDQNVVDP